MSNAFRIACVTAAALALLGVASFARAEDTVRVGLAAVYPAYAVPNAALALGYYKDSGLNVEITQFRGGPATQEALSAGSIDISTIAPAPAGLAIAKGVKEKIVALSVPPTPSGWFIMVPSASPIKTMAELNGKTVGVTQKASLTDMWVLRAAKQAGITVTTVPLGAPGVMPGLKAKQVDAALMWPLFSYKGVVDGEFRTIDDLGATMEPSIPEGWAVSSAMIDGHPDVLRRWLAANAKALLYMQSHETWAVDFLKKYTEESDDRVAKLAYDNFIKKIPADGVMKPQWMQASFDLATAAGITGLPPLDKVFTTAFTPVKTN
jgi:ABC-type nitrate/sulfonate/bicarbonate transport system substrate-binding protein